MADFYSHTELIKKVIKKLDFDFNHEIAIVGSQGPDPLYYNVFAKDGKDYRYYGDRMHDTSTQNLLINMVKYVQQHPTKDNISFLTGFISHYALDVTLHPYVYYNVGDYRPNNPETHIYRGLHLKFERSIDAYLIQEQTGKKAHKHKLYKTHYTVKHIPEDVCKIIGYTLKQTYGKDNGTEMFYTGVNKMYRNLRYFVHDPFGIKKFFFKFLDLFHKNSLLYQDISMYNHLEHYDYVNKQNNTWHHPITNEPSTKSVYELLEDAETFTLDIMSDVLDYILHNKDIDLTKVFTNLSFNSGMDCCHSEDMKYFNIYRK